MPILICSRIYLITLSKDTPSPLALSDDQVKIVENAPAVNEASQKNKKTSEVKPVENELKNIKVDLEGIMDRIISLPVQPANYGNLEPAGDKLFYNMSSRLAGTSTSKYYDLKEKKKPRLVREYLSHLLRAERKCS